MLSSTKLRSSIYFSWIAWTFFFVVVYVSRRLFSLPGAMDGGHLFVLWLIGIGVTVLTLFVIWFFRTHSYRWILSITVNLVLVALLALVLDTVGFQEGQGFVGPIEEKEAVVENEFGKITVKKKVGNVAAVRYDFFTVYLIVLGIVYTVVAVMEVNESKLDGLALRERLTQAQLDALRAQLNPHFMFNALHTVSGLMEEDTEEAQQVLEDFSYLLRNVIDKSKVQFTSLEEELSFIQKYIGIEQKRFEEKMDIQYVISEESLTAKVPAMILQPIVENAIKHGIFPKREKGCIEIKSEIIEDRLVLSIIDDGPGIKEDKTVHGVGIKNTLDRLHNLYQGNASFTFKTRSPHGLMATIDIPYTDH